MKNRYIITSASRQRGLTLIEFMISITLGMILVAAISVLIANQSSARTEIDRGGRLIENGRYAMQVVTDDLMMAGYWGESDTAPTGVTAFGSLPNPCSITMTAADDAANPGIREAAYFWVQGYDGSTYTSSTLTCTPNWKAGTDVIVVRYTNPDVSAVLTGGVTDLSKLTDGQVYLQTGLANATASSFSYKFFTAANASNAANFPLVNKSGAVQAPRKWNVHLYYIATCSVCTGGSVDTIPTLKRVELTVASGIPSITTAVIAEGIENMQIDYGVDDDPVNAAAGSPYGVDVTAANTRLDTPEKWRNVVSARVYLLVRSSDTAAGYTNSKKFAMGAQYPASAPLDPGADSYQRHLFSQVIRLVNPSSRRSS